MPKPKIIYKRIGYSNSVLIANQNNSILVDTGVRGRMRNFRILFREAGVQPEDIKLIVLTHTHYDHTGNLRELVNYTGAKVLVHQNEFGNLKNGFTPIPLGQGKYSNFISELGRKLHPTYASPHPFVAHIINPDKFNLNAFEIDGEIISTPGHTNGSQSVLIGKQLIAGDTFLNMRNGRIFPPFANDPKVLLETWENLFQLNIETIYPGHGKRFTIEKSLKDYELWKQKLYH